MQLKRWDTNEVIFEMDCDCWGDLLKGALKAKINFYRADFNKADFSDYDFRGSNFSDSDFSDSDFSNSDFSGSDFSDSNFSDSNFTDSDFSDSDFSDSDFSDSNFSDSIFSDSNFRNSDFRRSDFRGSNFSGSNFSGSKHQNKIGNMKEWKSIQLDTYMIVFNKHILAIGCQQHTIKEWESFTDEDISKMDSNALVWWTKWKEFVFQAIELSYKKETK